MNKYLVDIFVFVVVVVVLAVNYFLSKPEPKIDFTIPIPIVEKFDKRIGSQSYTIQRAYVATDKQGKRYLEIER